MKNTTSYVRWRKSFTAHRQKSFGKRYSIQR